MLLGVIMAVIVTRQKCLGMRFRILQEVRWANVKCMCRCFGLSCEENHLFNEKMIKFHKNESIMRRFLQIFEIIFVLLQSKFYTFHNDGHEEIQHGWHMPPQ